MKKTLRTTLIVLIAMMVMAIATITANAATSVDIKTDKISVSAGTTKQLGYSYEASEKPEWTSSNTAVATVSQDGKVTAKKAGTVEITIEADGVEDSCTVTVTPEARWLNANDAYTQLNNYRKSAKKSIYNEEMKAAKKIKNKKNRKKAQNKAKANLKKNYTLKKDASLEKIAKVRAEEMAKSGKFSHTRPNGKSGLTLIPGNVAKGENIAMGQKTCKQVSQAWYASPGHKKNMLRYNFTRVGIACYEYKGVTYWAQVFAG